jgi:hypothetical protein
MPVQIRASGGVFTERFPIFMLLDAIDNDILPLSFNANSGKVIDLAKDGHAELGGWYMGTDGFRDWYSKERLNDCLAE